MTEGRVTMTDRLNTDRLRWSFGDLPGRMQHALLQCAECPQRAVRSPSFPGEFAGRTYAGLEHRGLVERCWTGPDAGKYVITRAGLLMAESVSND